MANETPEQPVKLIQIGPKGGAKVKPPYERGRRVCPDGLLCSYGPRHGLRGGRRFVGRG